MDKDSFYYLNLIVTALRLAPLMKKVSFNVYLITWGSLLGLIFIISLLFSMALRINKPSSSFYQASTSVSKFITSVFGIFLVVPIAGI